MARKTWDHGGKTKQQRGYGKEHERIRAELLRTVILCEHCKAKGIVRPGTIADHVTPLARGGSGHRSNYQLLCKDCADAKDAADRGVAIRKGSDVTGWPTDPLHPWNCSGGGRL